MLQQRKEENKLSWRLLIFLLVMGAIIVFMAVILITDAVEQAELEQRLELVVAREQKLRCARQRVGREQYELLLQTAQDALPGIVCWGDESMAGGNGDSLPRELHAAADQALFYQVKRDLYKKADIYWTGKLTANVAFMAAVNEGFREILARSGAIRMVLGQDYSLAEFLETNTIPLADAEGNPLLFARQDMAKFGTTRIAGATGSLYVGMGTPDLVHMNMVFGRTDGKPPETAPAGTPVYTAGASRYRSYAPVLFFAEREDVTAEEFAEGIEKLLARYRPGACVLIVTTEAGSHWDRTLRETFGACYIRNDKNVAEMQREDYQSLAESTFTLLRQQGLFDEMDAAVASVEERLAEPLS